MSRYSISKKLTIFLLSTVLMFAILEAVLRYLGYTPNPFHVNSAITGDTQYTFARPDPELGWVNKAGTPVAAEKGNEKMTILESGQRVNASMGKKTISKRVVIVGCSITMGYGVKDEETYPFLLDLKYPDVEFENYGSGGYGTLQSFLLLKRIFDTSKGKQKPDLVIYGYMSAHKERNVVTDAWAFALTDLRGHTLTPPHALFDKNRSLVTYPLSIVTPWPLEGHSALVHLVHKKIRALILKQRRVQRDPVTFRLISDMNDYVTAQGSKFLLVFLHTSDFKYKSKEIIVDPLVEQLTEKGIANLVCNHPEWDIHFKDYVKAKIKNNPLLINGNGHPIPLLHKYWADCISDYINNKKLIH